MSMANQGFFAPLESFGSSVISDVKNLGNVLGSIGSPQKAPVYTPPSQPTATPIVKPTSAGGATFPTSVASSYSQTSPQSTTPTTPTTQPSLSSFLSNSVQTPNGGTLSLDGKGNPTGFTPSTGYSINTSGPVSSNALGYSGSAGDLYGQHSQYSDYVNALSQAQGYGPDYIKALQGQYGAQTQGAQLNLNSATLNSNLYTGNNLPGDTESYAQGATAKAQAQNTLEQASNNIQQLGANQALNTAQLQRTGAIAAAQSQLQYNPVAVSGENAINQYNSLQQQYPAASIPAYNPALSPATNQQIAQELVSNSPAYRSQFQSTFQQAGGGTGIYSKLDVGGLQKNQDGTYTLVPAAAAALGSANANVLITQLGNLSTIQGAIDASSKTLETTTKFMQQYGLNDTDTPIVTQIQNKIKDQTTQRGAIAGLNADLNALRSDYSQFLIGRGGSIAGTGPNSPEVLSAIPDNISAKQLQTLVTEMQQTGTNTAQAVNTQVQNALRGLQTGTALGGANSSGSTSGGWGSLGD